MISTRKRDVKLKSGTIIDCHSCSFMILYKLLLLYSPSHAGRKYRSMW